MIFAFTSNGLQCHPDDEEASATFIEGCSFKCRSCVINSYFSSCLNRLQRLIDSVRVCFGMSHAGDHICCTEQIQQ